MTKEALQYKTIQVGRLRMKLHRYIMQQHIGRQLLPTEIVHHINFDHLDNRIANLQIMSRKEHNHIHGHTHRITYKKGSDAPRSKLTEADVREIRRNYKLKPLLLKDIGEAYGVHLTVIWKVIHRQLWRHI